MGAKISYRPDIDGLRGMAVLSVLLYHYNSEWLPGGFTGVDLFFVISGYLITSILRSELGAGEFSFWGFYGRRIRRILPPLVVVVGASIVVGWFILMPGEYASLGASAVHSALGLGNIFFYQNTGYFDLAAELQPLLHTWSLGVEEQFYLLWPTLLWLGYRLLALRTLFTVILTAIGVVLFAYAARKVGTDPSGAFYLPHARAWELIAGALVSFLPPIRAQWASIAKPVGLGLIGWSLFRLSDSNAFPGVNALFACCGAALLVWPETEATIVTRALSAQPVVAIGLISYSLYLWHWPVLVFFRQYTFVAELDAFQSLMLFATSASLAVISYFLIERPSRYLTLGTAAATSATIIISIVIAGSLITSSGGLPARLSEKAQTLAAASQDFSPFRATCHRSDETNLPVEASCLFGDVTVRPDTVIWGDSHGVELAEAFGPFLARRNRSLQQITYSSCPPVQDFSSPLQKGCEDFSKAVLRYLENPEIKDVYLAIYYDLYIDSLPRLWSGLRETIQRLEHLGKKVTLIAPVPNPGYPVPQAAARRAMVDPEALLTFPFDQYLDRSGATTARIEKLKREFPNLMVLDPAKALCSEACNMVIDGHPVLFDDNHLSRHGAAAVAKQYWSGQN